VTLKFSNQPGSRERHLKRKYQNPLFSGSEVVAEDVLLAQKQDAEEVESFMEAFRALVEQAAGLDANAEADVVLKIKEQLDKAYEQCAGLAGDHVEIRGMLEQLIKAVMQSMWKAIGPDPEARSKLEMEESARQAHFALLQEPLIVDLLSPDSCIIEQDLVPALLSESAGAVRLAMQLFEPEQQAQLCSMAKQLVDGADQSLDIVAQAGLRLAEMGAYLETANKMPD